MPSALLSAALGLAIASANLRAVLLGFATLVVVTCAIALVPVPRGFTDVVFLACWTSIIGTAAIVYSSRVLKGNEAVALSFNAGVWTGALIALAPPRIGVVEALPLALCAWPAAWARRRGQAVILMVLASWLIAVAVLAATLQFLPVTPGYLPDHIE